MLPSASDSLRKASRLASGSGASPNQLRNAGSRVRWIAARRLRPEVSASIFASAPAGSAYPSAVSRDFAAAAESFSASVLSWTSAGASRATVERIGR